MAHAVVNGTPPAPSSHGHQRPLGAVDCRPGLQPLTDLNDLLTRRSVFDVPGIDVSLVGNGLALVNGLRTQINGVTYVVRRSALTQIAANDDLVLDNSTTASQIKFAVLAGQRNFMPSSASPVLPAPSS